jgi:hypothetical protein
MPWRFGDHVLLRTRSRGQLSWVVPATIVEDSPDLIALYVSLGSPAKVKVGLDGTQISRSLPYRERFGKPWTLADGTWRHSSVLWLTKPDLPYMVGVFWEGSERRYTGQYCNIQDPLERHGLGFDSVDHVLDVQFWPDGTWSWKDEDEFDDAREVGRFTLNEAAQVRRTGQQVIAAWEAQEWPFDRDWTAWKPDPSWGVPPMPPNWDE